MFLKKKNSILKIFTAGILTASFILTNTGFGSKPAAQASLNAVSESSEETSSTAEEKEPDNEALMEILAKVKNTFGENEVELEKYLSDNSFQFIEKWMEIK